MNPGTTKGRNPSSPAATARPRGRTDGSDTLAQRIFAGLFGTFLALALLKFSNPAIMEKWTSTPRGFYEIVLGYPWPITWGYWVLGVVAVSGLATARWKVAVPKWLSFSPLAWLGWQMLAASRTVDASLSGATLPYFVVTLACFYLGLYSLSGIKSLWLFWLIVLGAFLLVLAAGWEQHFGGLEATRQYFLQYMYPQMKDVPPEYLKKLTSNRIFGTLFYPNTLAGALVLLLPGLLTLIWQMRRWFTASARGFLVTVVGIAGLACLFWSGSKGGWLLMLLVGLLALLRLPFARAYKVALITGVLLLGLTGFFLKYAGFFQKGATSVSARFVYWRAAVQIVKAHPVLGSGPGTFGFCYLRMKKPGQEGARLTHNDFLQQASDSGLPGFLAYVVFITGAVVWSYPKTVPPEKAADASGTPLPAPAKQKEAGLSNLQPFRRERPDSWLRFMIWLGVLGWSLQGFIEFGLYIPGLAWPGFTLLGWLVGSKLGIDNSPGGR
jgi:O-antigen ligase